VTGSGQISVVGNGWIEYPTVLGQAGVGGLSAHLTTVNIKGALIATFDEANRTLCVAPTTS